MPARPEPSTLSWRSAARQIYGLALGLLVLVTLPLQTQAANFSGHWFQVEVIIFAYDGAGATPLAQLADEGLLDVPKRYLTLRSRKQALLNSNRRYNGTQIGHSGRLEDDPFISLPASMRMLNSARSRLNSNGAYRILLHRAWRQPLFEHYRSLPLLIRAGNQIGNRRELEGVLKLSVETYLAVEADLRLYNQTSVVTTQGSVSPDQENWHKQAFAAESQYPQLAGEGRFYTESASALHAVALRESRGRIRSGEIHYLDHPRLGMLIHFTRYAAP